jgi:hypothetical protein
MNKSIWACPLGCLALAFDRCLDGVAAEPHTAPGGLTVTGLAKALPYSWAEQGIGLPQYISARVRKITSYGNGYAGLGREGTETQPQRKSGKQRLP